MILRSLLRVLLLVTYAVAGAPATGGSGDSKDPDVAASGSASGSGASSAAGTGGSGGGTPGPEACGPNVGQPGPLDPSLDGMHVVVAGTGARAPNITKVAP